MPSQRVLILSIGGPLADAIWNAMIRWEAIQEEMESCDDDSDPVRHLCVPPQNLVDASYEEVVAFVDRLAALAYTPPVLYRCEYVDCWSMGDSFMLAMRPSDPTYFCGASGGACDVYAAWRHCKERLVVPRRGADEERWLRRHVNQATGAWGGFAERRLVILVRNIFAGLWSDEEVRSSIQSVPDWWAAAHPPAPHTYTQGTKFVDSRFHTTPPQ